MGKQLEFDLKIIKKIILDTLRTCEVEDMPTDNYLTHLFGKFGIKNWKTKKKVI